MGNPIVGRTLAVGLLTLTLGSSAAAEGVPIDAATKAQTASARSHYKIGMAAFKQGKYEAALEEFEASFAVVASPNSHLMIARTLVKLERHVAAYQAMQATLTEAEAAANSGAAKYKKTVESAKSELADIAKGVATLTLKVEAPEGSVVKLAGHERRLPGAVEATLTLPDGTVVKQSAELTAGGSGDIVLAPPAPKPDPRPKVTPKPLPAPSPADAGPADEPNSRRTIAYVAGGIGVTGFIAFGVFGILNNSKFGNLEDSCPAQQCPERLRGEADTGQTYQTLANVGLVLGVIGIGSAAALLLTEPASVTQAKRKPARLIGSSDLFVGPRGVSLRGTF